MQTGILGYIWALVIRLTIAVKFPDRSQTINLGHFQTELDRRRRKREKGSFYVHQPNFSKPNVSLWYSFLMIASAGIFWFVMLWEDKKWK